METATDTNAAMRRLGAEIPWLPPMDIDAQARAALVAAERRARARTLSVGDISYAIGLYEDALDVLREAELRPHSVVVEVHGGRVPNAYSYVGEATWATIDSRAGLSVRRAPAMSGPRATGWGTRVTGHLHAVPAADQRPLLRDVKARRQDEFKLCWYYD